jgi:hypothetical protein
MALNVANTSTLVVSTGDPTTVNDATALNPLGSILTVLNSTGFSPGLTPRVYQYVQLKSDATAAKGAVVLQSDLFNYVVTTVGTATSANRNLLVGYLQSTSLAAGNFGFIQIGGLGHVLIENASTPAVGQQLIQGATTAGRSDTVALATAPTSGPYGVVISLKNAVVNGSAAIGTDVVAAYINIPFRLS